MTNQTRCYPLKSILLILSLLLTFISESKAFNCETPMITISDTVEVCRLDSGIDSLCINFNNQVEGSTGIWTQDAIVPGFNFSAFPLDSVCFEGIQTGCYPFTFTTNTAEAPCMDTMATMIVCVNACPCPSPATQPIPDICNIDSYNLEESQLSADPGIWSVISGPASQDISNIITDAIFNAENILPGLYVVRFTLDNPGNENCEAFSEQTINVIGQEQIFVLDTGLLCNIEGEQYPNSIDLFSLISVDSTDGGIWLQIGGTTSIPIIDGSIISGDDIIDLPQTFIFEYTSNYTGGPCPPAKVEVMVNIVDCTCPMIMLSSDTLCNDGMPIDLFTLLTNDENLPGTWSTNGNLVGASMFDPNGLPSGLYDITFTLDTDPGEDCDSVYSNNILVRRKPNAESIVGLQPCNVDTGNGPTTVNLYDWLEAGYSSGSWVQIEGDVLAFTDNGLDMAIVDFANEDIGESFTFIFTTTSAIAPCTNKSVEIVITVVDCNCPLIELSDPSPVNNDGGAVDMCSLTGASDPGTFTVLNESGEDQSAQIDSTGCIFDVTDISPGTYSIIYTLDVQVPSICVQSDTMFLDVLEVLATNFLARESFQIYPNPTHEILHIKSDYSIMALNLWTTTGNSIFKASPFKVNNVKIDMTPYPSGLYLLQLETDKGRLIEKVIRK